MNRTLRICVLVAAILLALMIFSLSSSIGQDRKPYEVQTRVYGVEAGRSDTARAVDAYERLMERYMDQSREDFARLDARIEALDRTLAAVDAKLAALDSRLARIEQHLGVKPAASAPDPNRPAQPTATIPEPAAQR
jgi:septal ring factor EnvC (AmiA/AmiB activator)